jgi:pilus assembly protein Flp/PilA
MRTGFKELLNDLTTDESGQDLIEYALVAALVGLGAVASMNTLATQIGSTFNSVGNNLTSSL